MKRVWRAQDVGYARAAFLDAENRRWKRKGVTKEEFRRAIMELAARRRERDGVVQ